MRLGRSLVLCWSCVGPAATHLNMVTMQRQTTDMRQYNQLRAMQAPNMTDSDHDAQGVSKAAGRMRSPWRWMRSPWQCCLACSHTCQASKHWESCLNTLAGSVTGGGAALGQAWCVALGMDHARCLLIPPRWSSGNSCVKPEPHTQDR